MSEEAALSRRVVPLCRKKTSAHELAFAVLNSNISNPVSADAEFKSDKSGIIYKFTCDAPKRVDGITVVIAKKVHRKELDEDGGVGTITVTINNTEETKDKAGLGEPLP